MRLAKSLDWNHVAKDYPQRDEACCAEADAGQDVFNLSHSLPPDLGFHQSLTNPSRSAPPIAGQANRMSLSDPYFSYATPMANGMQNGHQQKPSLGSAAYDLQPGTLAR